MNPIGEILILSSETHVPFCSARAAGPFPCLFSLGKKVYHIFLVHLGQFQDQQAYY